MALAVIHEPLAVIGPPPPGLNGVGGYAPNPAGGVDVTMACVFVGDDVVNGVVRDAIVVTRTSGMTAAAFNAACLAAADVLAARLGYAIPEVLRLFSIVPLRTAP